MAISKHRNMDWTCYLRELAESPSKISDIEKVELSGHLLRRDMEEGKFFILEEIFSQDNYSISDFVASFLIAESPDSTFDLLQSVRHLVVDYYSDHMQHLITQEEEIIVSQKPLLDPREEFYSDEAI